MRKPTATGLGACLIALAAVTLVLLPRSQEQGERDEAPGKASKIQRLPSQATKGQAVAGDAPNQVEVETSPVVGAESASSRFDQAALEGLEAADRDNRLSLHANRINSIFASLKDQPVGNPARKIVEDLVALRAQGLKLSSEEQDKVYALLKSKQAPDGLNAGQWHWVVDELYSSLRALGSDNSRVVDFLEKIYRDAAYDPVVRDYALQHLGHLHAEGGNAIQIEKVLAAAVGEADATLAGVALLALHRAASQEGLSSDIDLGQVAQRVAANPAVDLRSRLTALQVAGKQGNAAALPLAASIAGDQSQPVPLRVSALATIGDLGVEQYSELITGLTKSQDPRIRGAAIASLAKQP